MSHARTLFPGAMGPDGFISCFDHLMSDADIRRKIILKGGPGVGKSTFMRRIHAHLCSEGADSTLYFCSGDPDSLDAVAVPHAGLLILDGTAPHIVDPTYPGARDSIINLGEYLDEHAIRPRLAHIRVCMSDHAHASRRARACLQAARTLCEDNAALVAEVIDDKRMTGMRRALTAAVLSTEGEKSPVPHVRPVITDAITPKGELCLIPEGTQKRVIRIVHHFAMDPTPVLRTLSAAILEAGYDVEEHLCPALPGRLMHLSIPALSTIVTTGDLPHSEQTFDFAACIPAGSLLRRECALEQAHASIRMHRSRAIQALSQAKQLHDELETFYVPNMDFSRWQTKLDETLALFAQ